MARRIFGGDGRIVGEQQPEMLGKALAEVIFQLRPIGLEYVAIGVFETNVAIGGEDVLRHVVADPGRHQHVFSIGDLDGAGSHRDLAAAVIGDAVGDEIDFGALGRRLAIELGARISRSRPRRTLRFDESCAEDAAQQHRRRDSRAKRISPRFQPLTHIPESFAAAAQCLL